jgi:hypothetical protein
MFGPSGCYNCSTGDQTIAVYVVLRIPSPTVEDHRCLGRSPQESTSPHNFDCPRQGSGRFCTRCCQHPNNPSLSRYTSQTDMCRPGWKHHALLSPSFALTNGQESIARIGAGRGRAELQGVGGGATNKGENHTAAEALPTARQIETETAAKKLSSVVGEALRLRDRWRRRLRPKCKCCQKSRRV